jgi:hypothetical protein
VIIADMRSSMVAADSAAAVGCVFDFDVYVDISGAARRIYGVAATPSDTVRGAKRLTIPR